MPSVKPTLHALQTPKSASFPSELPRSPLPSGVPELIKHEDCLKTPITPPTAYIDFLKALSVTSPSIKSDRPSLTSNPSSESSMSSWSSSGTDIRRSPRFAVPPSPYAKPMSAPATGSLRRLRIPPSPVRSPGAESPMSARSIRSPFSIRSPNEWESSDARARALDTTSASCKTRPVSVRQVVTRTVTYTPRMDLAPAPKGKKRRIE
ncbi:MAG: hypothetical protein M1817_003577 [Caeruleum heppii]|nr:MAG: hypothetical protein M1817_003577 [Caeruleum heppii]